MYLHPKHFNNIFIKKDAYHSFPPKGLKKMKTCHPVATSKNVVYLEIIDPPHRGTGT